MHYGSSQTLLDTPIAMDKPLDIADTRSHTRYPAVRSSLPCRHRTTIACHARFPLFRMPSAETSLRARCLHLRRAAPTEQREQDDGRGREGDESDAEEGQRAGPVGREVSSDFVHHVVPIAPPPPPLIVVLPPFPRFFVQTVPVVVLELVLVVRAKAGVATGGGGRRRRRRIVASVPRHPAPAAAGDLLLVCAPSPLLSVALPLVYVEPASCLFPPVPPSHSFRDPDAEKLLPKGTTAGTGTGGHAAGRQRRARCFRFRHRSPPTSANATQKRPPTAPFTTI